MKTVSKLLMLIFGFVICLSLFACKPSDEPDDEKPTVTNPEEDYIYCEGSEIYIIYPEGDAKAESLAIELGDIMRLQSSSHVYVANDTRIQAKEHEITIGNTNRNITSQAYRALDRISFYPEDEVRYLAYSDGKSVALLYDEDIFDISVAASVACNKFVNDYAKSTKLVLKPGVVYYDIINPLEDQKEIDNAKQEEAWQKVIADLGGDDRAENLVATLKNYYEAIASEDLLSWLANLYDIQTGAFYYSNSGRNTVGFLPDVESTQQAFSFLSHAGIFTDDRGLSPEMKTALGKWVKSLQHPNGYFYHPQWTIELIDSKLSRRGRDLSCAIVLLNKAGIKPTYDTPLGNKGDYTLIDGTKVDKNGNPVLPDAELTGRLIASSAPLAVSKIISVASSTDLPNHLSSQTKFEAYLGTLDIRNQSYSVGNTLASQAGQIKKCRRSLRRCSYSRS